MPGCLIPHLLSEDPGLRYKASDLLASQWFQRSPHSLSTKELEATTLQLRWAPSVISISCVLTKPVIPLSHFRPPKTPSPPIIGRSILKKSPPAGSPADEHSPAIPSTELASLPEDGEPPVRKDPALWAHSLHAYSDPKSRYQGEFLAVRNQTDVMLWCSKSWLLLKMLSQERFSQSLACAVHIHAFLGAWHVVRQKCWTISLMNALESLPSHCLYWHSPRKCIIWANSAICMISNTQTHDIIDKRWKAFFQTCQGFPHVILAVAARDPVEQECNAADFATTWIPIDCLLLNMSDEPNLWLRYCISADYMRKQWKINWFMIIFVNSISTQNQHSDAQKGRLSMMQCLSTACCHICVVCLTHSPHVSLWRISTSLLSDDAWNMGSTQNDIGLLYVC